jgi:N6-L-threonylcarbamoyladenine synthase
MKYILGIDTSCYTTSVSGVSMEGDVVFSRQVPLTVPEGERGLQQSGALFQHIKNLPLATAQIRKSLPHGNIVAVCSSTRPRPVEGSYMPVFLFSHHIGQVIADLNNIPFYKTSHQENHIMAGLHSGRMPYLDHFLVVHLSGGTSELLNITRKSVGFDIHLLGGSQDLHAGQFVDRIGVAMGLPFPAGPHLEVLAASAAGSVDLSGSVQGLNISFSGPESQAQRLIQQGVSHSEIALAVYQLLVRTVAKWILHAVDQGYPDHVLLVGGVSSSRIFRTDLKKRLAKRNRSICLHFAEPNLSKDNAVGTALLGLQAYKKDLTI